MHQRFILIVAGCLLLLAASAEALEASELEQELRAAYEGKVVTVRNFYQGARLAYDAEGELTEETPTGPWTLYGRVRVKQVSLTGSKLLIEGERLFLAYDRETWEFQPSAHAEEVWLEIAAEPGAEGTAKLRRALDVVFLSEDERLSEQVPRFWRHFLANHKQRPERVLEERRMLGPSVPKTLVPDEGEVVPPRCVFCSGASYTQAALRANVEGTTLLAIVIDKTGGVTDINIVMPLGLGLDEAALRAVRGWQYEPAERHGKPVQVLMIVEVPFEAN